MVIRGVSSSLPPYANNRLDPSYSLRNTWSYQYDGFGRLTWARRGVGDGGYNGPAGSGPGGGFGMMGGSASASTLPASALGVLGTVALALSVPLLALTAVTTLPGMVAGALVGAVGGALVGGIATGTLEGALGGAFMGAVAGAAVGSIHLTGGFIIAAAIATGIGSAAVNAASNLSAGSPISLGGLAVSFLLGTVAGFYGAAGMLVANSPLVGASIAALSDIGFTALATYSSSPSSTTGPGAVQGYTGGLTVHSSATTGVVEAWSFTNQLGQTYMGGSGVPYLGLMRLS
jgi:hypothetical protein